MPKDMVRCYSCFRKGQVLVRTEAREVFESWKEGRSVAAETEGRESSVW